MKDENDSSITCEAAREHLTAFMDGEPVSSAITRHLAACPACVAACNEQGAINRLADVWQVEEQDVWARIQERIQQDAFEPQGVRILTVETRILPQVESLEETLWQSRRLTGEAPINPPGGDALEANPTLMLEPELSETALILAELRAMRFEIAQLRGEVAHLRRQAAALQKGNSRSGSVPLRPETQQQTRLFPFAPSSEPPIPFGG